MVIPTLHAQRSAWHLVTSTDSASWGHSVWLELIPETHNLLLIGRNLLWSRSLTAYQIVFSLCCCAIGLDVLQRLSDVQILPKSQYRDGTMRILHHGIVIFTFAPQLSPVSVSDLDTYSWLGTARDGNFIPSPWLGLLEESQLVFQAMMWFRKILFCQIQQVWSLAYKSGRWRKYEHRCGQPPTQFLFTACAELH